MQKKVRQLNLSLRPLTACLLCLYVVLPLFASAQIDTAKKLKEVKVKNRRLPQIQTTTPSQQVTANDFERYSAFNIADAIRNFSGVNIKDYGGIGGLKTVSVRSLGANHLAVLYDGVQINDAQNGQIDLGNLNLTNIAKITLYNGQPEEICQPARSFASAHVLAITTIQPNLSKDKPYRFLVGAKGGSFGLIDPYLQWQQRLGDKWSLVINSYWEKANGRYKYKVSGDGSDTASTRTNADVDAKEADGALYWKQNDSSKFNLHVNYYNSDRGLPGAVVFYNPASNQRLKNRDIFVQSGYEYIWQSSLHLLINAKLSNDYTNYIDPDFLNSTGGLNERYTQRELYQSAALAYHLTKNWEISYAIDGSESSLDANLASYAYPSRFTLLNVLASKLTAGKWRFEGNLLNTHVSESVKSGNPTPVLNVLSPTLVANYQPLNTPDLELRAFYKDIYREPTFNEQYYFSVNGSRNIKPEYAKQYDLGISYRKAFNSVADYVTLTIDGYYNNVTNKIIALPNSNPAIFSILNLGKVDIKGVDVGLKTSKQLSGNWYGDLSINYTYQHAIDVTDPASSNYRNQIPYTPKNTLAFNAGVDDGALGFYYNQVLSSSRYYLNQNQPQNLVDGYSVSDVSFIYKFLAYSKQAIFSAHLNNVFNQNYVIVRSFPMPGRSVLFSFQITI